MRQGWSTRANSEEYTSCTENKAPSETHKPRCTAIIIHKEKYVDCSWVWFRMCIGAQSTSNYVWKWIELNPLQSTVHKSFNTVDGMVIAYSMCHKKIPVFRSTLPCNGNFAFRVRFRSVLQLPVFLLLCQHLKSMAQRTVKEQ